MARPTIGNPVVVNLGRQQEYVDAFARRNHISRAAAVRQLIDRGLSAKIKPGWWQEFDSYPDDLESTYEVHIRLGELRDIIDTRWDLQGGSRSFVIRGLVDLGYRRKLKH